MARFYSLGKTMNYTSETALVAGAAVAVGSIIGIAEAGCAAGGACSLTIGGAFEFVASSTITQGAKVYLDAEGKATTASESNKALGVALTAANTNMAVVVKIND